MARNLRLGSIYISIDLFDSLFRENSLISQFFTIFKLKIFYLYRWVNGETKSKCNDFDLFLIDDFDFDLKTFIFWRRTKKFFKRFRLKNVTDKNGNKLTFSLFICSLNKQFSKLGRAVIVAQLAERSLPTTGGPRFESSHQPLLLNHYIPFAVCRKGEK